MSDDVERWLKENFAIYTGDTAEPAGPVDHHTHLDLGVAYAEMGLLDDAIGEFEEVLRAAPDHLQARAELEAARLRRNRGGP